MVDKKALIMLKFLLKTRQNDCTAYTREWATAQRTRALAVACASGCRACSLGPMYTLHVKKKAKVRP